ncbi:retrovirus-related pol polyprotein from transposon TNT 1-94 [Tanacetum coccineum]
MFRIDPSQPSRVDKVVPNKHVKANVRTKPITISQPHVNTKKDVNSNSNGLSSTGVKSTSKTRRPQPRSNTKNDRVSSASMSSCIKNKDVEVEEHPRNLLLSNNKKHMSSEYNNIKLAIRNDKSKIICANCYLNLFMVRQLRFLQAHDQECKVAHQICLEVYRVYYVEGLGPNLFSVGQFCDSDLEVAYRRNTCYVRNLKGVDMLKGNRTTNLYIINLHEMASASLICLMARATSTNVGISHQTSSVRTTQWNGVVERRNRTLVEAARTIKLDISFLHVFGALCYPKNDHEDIGKLGAKGDIGFFIGYSANSCAYRVYNRRTKKIMETMNVTFDELSTMAFEQRISKPRLQGMTSGQISSGLDLTYASSTITSQKPTEHATRTVLAAPAIQNLQTPNASTTTADSAPTPTNSSSQFYLLHHPQWTNDHPLEQVIGEPSRPVMTRNQLRIDGEMCIYALSVSTIKPRNVKEAMTDLGWTDSMQEELLQFKRLDVYIDDIIFGSTNPRYTQLFADLIKSRFEMSMMREMTFFLSLQVNQSPYGIFINQSNYVLEIQKKYGMETYDPIGTSMETKNKLDLDKNGTPVDATKYRSMIGARILRQADWTLYKLLVYMPDTRLSQPRSTSRRLKGSFVIFGKSSIWVSGCQESFKSTSGGTQFLGEKLVSWSSKKQDCTTLSACCAQLLWMRTQLTDYVFHYNKIPIYYDS